MFWLKKDINHYQIVQNSIILYLFNYLNLVFKNLTSVRISATFIVSLLISWILLFNTNHNIGIVGVSVFGSLFLIVEFNFFLAEKTALKKRVSWRLFFTAYIVTVLLFGLIILKSSLYIGFDVNFIVLNLRNQIFLFSTIIIGIGMMLSTYIIYKKKYFAEQSLILEKQEFLQYSFNALKSQNVIKFLKESLETTKELIIENPDFAVIQLEKLTSILRHLLQTRDEKFVSLKRELEIVTEYCSLAELQIGKTVKLNIDVDPEFAHTKVPPLVFQMILEHQFLTFKHNSSEFIEIEVYIENQNFIVIKTSLPKIKRNDDRFIKNLKERYRLYNNSADLSILSTSKHHFVKLPLLIQFNN
jgi:sensor histidine kinase YesM